MPKLFDRVKVNIATTGTGDVTFGSASSNAFLTPTEAGCVDTDTVRYVIVDGTDYEEGVGTIASSVATMARTTVTSSKISGTAGTSKISLSGTAVLTLTLASADILIPANNLADLVSAATARTNLGGTTVGKALFTATDAAAARATIEIKFGQVKLAKSGSNIVLSPYGGNLLTIGGTSYPVPTSGVSLAPTGLTVGTVYYIYAYMNSGTMTLEASTTGHSTSSTGGNEGVEIKTGDDTRTLVGMVRIDSGTVFSDSATARYVRSWFNDGGVELVNYFTANRSITSTTAIEINSEIRLAVILWSGERLIADAQSPVRNSAASGTNSLGIDFDAAGAFSGGVSFASQTTANDTTTLSPKNILSGGSEGLHTVTLIGAVGSGTGLYFGDTSARKTSLRAFTRR